MFGIDHPGFGHLTDRMLLPDGVHLDLRRFVSPKVEGEIAFRVAQDLSDHDVTLRDVLDATTEVCPVPEVLDRRIEDKRIEDWRIEDWRIGLVDTVADNASSAAAVVGPASGAVDLLPGQEVDAGFGDLGSVSLTT